LLLGIQLTEPVAADVAREMLDLSVIVNAVAPAALRLAPPLVLSHDQAGEFIAALTVALDRVAAQVAGRVSGQAAALVSDRPSMSTVESA
jgi:acetylornithine aminotransferase